MNLQEKIQYKIAKKEAIKKVTKGLANGKSSIEVPSNPKLKEYFRKQGLDIDDSGEQREQAFFVSLRKSSQYDDTY